MDAIKKNIFWVVLGLAVLVEGWIYVTFISAMDADIEVKRGELTSKLSKLDKFAKKKPDPKKRPEEIKHEDFIMTDNWNKHFATLKGDYAIEYEKCLEYFKRKDEALLEMYFDDKGEPTAVKPVDRGAFSTMYSNKMAILREEIEKTVPTEKNAFTQESVSKLEEVPLVQKHFWIQEAVAGALKAAKATRLISIKFEPALPKSTDLPYLKVIPVIVTFEMPFSQVEVMAAELLQYPRLIFRVAALKTIRINDDAVLGEMKRNWIARQLDTEELRDKTPDEGLMTEPPVKVELVAEVLDFDFTAAPPQPPKK